MPLDFEIHPDITQAWTPPTHFYTSQALFEESLERIFARSWQFVGDLSLAQIPGQASPHTLLEGSLNEPILFTRDRNDTIHCLSNVCTHRGNILVEGQTVDNSLRCRYHGRRFDLDGCFKSMPEFEGVKDFPSPCDNLSRVPFAVWDPFLFASIAPAHPFANTFDAIRNRIDFLPLREAVLRPEWARDYMVQAHWALYVDNYLEGFHIPYIHAGLNATLDYGDYRVELLPGATLQLGTSKSEEGCFDIPAGHPDHGTNIAAYYYWIFPNTMVNVYPWGISINVVRPLAPNLTKVSFLPYVWDETKRGSGAGADLDRVEREDEAVVNLVQKGMRSRFYSRGRYSPAREDGTHHFHRLISDYFRSE